VTQYQSPGQYAVFRREREGLRGQAGGALPLRGGSAIDRVGHSPSACWNSALIGVALIPIRGLVYVLWRSSAVAGADMDRIAQPVARGNLSPRPRSRERGRKEEG
jgi:hypothetical protein